MLLTAGLVLLSTAFSYASPVQQPLQPQHVLDLPHASSQEGTPRKLRGKFLHITDIHPDPYYKQGTDPFGNHPCHSGHGRAGYFGAEKTECDTPLSLVNATFDWIKHNIKDEIDFVVWTGDSARHDNDEKIPRTKAGVEDLNRFIVTKFDEVFGKPDYRNDPDPTNDFVVPIVPTFGNNDILPHNIFEPGPNKWTRRYLSIWEKFIPQAQRHNFARGGWYFTEVIPNRLAVFSLNTLYFFDSNAAVDGCDSPSEPGYEHFEWLRIQLEFLRQRKMKAILIGHVPPARVESKQNWDESCYQKYTLWLRQYRDVIVGNIFGHMNIDHFILQDVRELKYKFDIPGIDDQGLRGGSSLSSGVHVQAKSDYLSDLRELWGNLPTPPNSLSYTEVDLETDKSGKKRRKNKKKQKRKKFLKEIGGPFGERFSLSLVSPSVVPNFYPTLRIIEYNITGLEKDHPALRPTAPVESDTSGMNTLQVYEEEAPERMETSLATADENYGIEKRKKKHKKKKGRKSKPNFIIPDPPSSTSPPGPGYSPQPLSFVSWRQLYANLTKINEAVAKELSFDEHADDLNGGQLVHEEIAKKHFTYELEYDTKNDSIRPLKDLTILSWIGYAEKISRAKYRLPSGMLESDVMHQYMDDASEQLAINDDTESSDASVEILDQLTVSADSASVDIDDADEVRRVYLECLEYLRKQKDAGLIRHNADDNDSWILERLRRLNVDLASLRDTDLDDPLDTLLSDENEDNDQDSGYDSDPEDGIEDNDETSDSGYEDPDDENDNNDNHNEEVSVSKKNKKRKCKGTSKKKCKKRKGQSLKNNHLWHDFVRRAFVQTKTWEELIDEFG